MVFNRRTYPNFVRLLEALGIEGRPSDMSFSVRAEQCGLEYQSTRLFAQRRNILSPGFWKMLGDILRFNRQVRGLFEGPKRDAEARDTASETIGQFLERGGFGSRFWNDYLLPMTGAIWSAPPSKIEEFPIAFLFGFLHNHGLLALNDRPQWLTIPGGSRRYVDALVAPIASRIETGRVVRRVARDGQGVAVEIDGTRARRFDAAILAVHAPQALAMLGDPTEAEKQVLGAFSYQANEAALHVDPALMPRRRRAWASWNCLTGADPSQPLAVTYDLNRLQGLGLSGPLCVTLNPPSPPGANSQIRSLHFEHPLYTADSIAAQWRRDELHRDGRVYFAGAYWGNGFHEDGVNSALAVCQRLGASLEDLQQDPPCTVASTRAESPTSVAAR
jgi:predicted NAD/FAD-binding protein